MTTAAGKDCVLGIDVSVYQPNIDWNTVAKYRQFAVIKASGGDGGLYADSLFPRHAANSKGKLPRGAYHFLGNGDGAGQARRFLQATRGYADLELPPTVDVETYGKNGQFRPDAQTVRDFISTVEREMSRRWTGPTGQPVSMIIYTGFSMASSLYPGIEKHDLWLAAYLNSKYPLPNPGVTNGENPNVAALGNPGRYVPQPFKDWSAWQFAGGDGGCPGVGDGKGNCDQNVMDKKVFGRLLGGSTQEEDDMPAYKDWDDDSKKAFKEDMKSVILDPEVTKELGLGTLYVQSGQFEDDNVDWADAPRGSTTARKMLEKFRARLGKGAWFWSSGQAKGQNAEDANENWPSIYAPKGYNDDGSPRS